MPQSGLILLLVVALGQTPPSEAHPSGFADQVRSEYQRALKELEALFSTVRGSGRSTSVGSEGLPDQRTEKGAVQFAKKPGMFRTSSSHRSTASADKESQGPDLAAFFNGSISVRLQKNPGSDSYVIIDTGAADQASRAQISMGLRSVLACPFAIEGPLISDILAKPEEYVITQVENLLSDSKRLLRIHYKYNRHKPVSSRPGRLVMEREGGWLLVSPTEHWVLREAVTRFKPAAGGSLVGDRHVSVQYGGSHDGIPLPKRYESKTVARLVGDKQEYTDPKGRVVRNGTVMSSFAFDFEEIRFDEAPDRDFTLAAFGLPDLGKPKALAARSNPLPWIFTIAGIALLLAILLRTYAAKLYKRPQQTVGEPTPP